MCHGLRDGQTQWLQPKTFLLRWLWTKLFNVHTPYLWSEEKLKFYLKILIIDLDFFVIWPFYNYIKNIDFWMWSYLLTLSFRILWPICMSKLCLILLTNLVCYMPVLFYMLLVFVLWVATFNVDQSCANHNGQVYWCINLSSWSLSQCSSMYLHGLV